MRSPVTRLFAGLLLLLISTTTRSHGGAYFSNQETGAFTYWSENQYVYWPIAAEVEDPNGPIAQIYQTYNGYLYLLGTLFDASSTLTEVAVERVTYGGSPSGQPEAELTILLTRAREYIGLTEQSFVRSQNYPVTDQFVFGDQIDEGTLRIEYLNNDDVAAFLIGSGEYNYAAGYPEYGLSLIYLGYSTSCFWAALVTAFSYQEAEEFGTGYVGDVLRYYFAAMEYYLAVADYYNDLAFFDGSIVLQGE